MMDARDRAVTRILKASGAYEEDDPTTLVTDMLTDLIHFSQQHGVSFDRRLEAARQHYEEEHDPQGECAERFGPRDEDECGNAEDIAALKRVRASVEEVSLRYEPGQSMYTLMREVSDLCTAEISAIAEVGAE